MGGAISNKINISLSGDGNTNPMSNSPKFLAQLNAMNIREKEDSIIVDLFFVCFDEDILERSIIHLTSFFICLK